MNTLKKAVNRNICEKMTQIQQDLDRVLLDIFQKAGRKIQAEQQAQYLEAIANTKKIIERFKHKYGCPISLGDLDKKSLKYPHCHRDKGMRIFLARE